MASGVLRSDGLQVNDIRSVTRDELLALLREPPEGAVASVDFPFSVPQPFANVLAGSPNDMADVWAGVADMSMEEFIALRDTFVAEHGEMRRECDLSHGEAFSVLHKANPNMLPMTLRGMQMLHQPASSRMCASSAKTSPAQPNSPCWSACPAPPSRVSASPTRPIRTGAVETNSADRILNGLASAVPVSLANVEEISEQCLAVHDALDAVVAALNSAVYITCPEAVSTPPDGDIYRLEGWIYHIQPVPA